jgi:hypothetical protein
MKEDCTTQWNVSQDTIAIDTYTLMFSTTLFIIAKLSKQSRCPTTDEWAKKM